MTENNDTKFDQETVFNIETRLAFQEDLLDALNKTVSDQQKQIEQLWNANRTLKQQLEKMHFESDNNQDNSPPPHY